MTRGRDCFRRHVCFCCKANPFVAPGLRIYLSPQHSRGFIIGCHFPGAFPSHRYLRKVGVFWSDDQIDRRRSLEEKEKTYIFSAAYLTPGRPQFHCFWWFFQKAGEVYTSLLLVQKGALGGRGGRGGTRGGLVIRGHFLVVHILSLFLIIFLSEKTVLCVHFCTF